MDKLIERLRGYCQELEAYRREQCRHDLEDAAEEISKIHGLRAENEKLRAELERVTAERDAAVESIPRNCKTCAYHTVFFNGCTPDHDCTNPDGGCSNNYDRWQWRGIKKED